MTLQEYESAFSSFQECMRRRGRSVIDLEFDEGQQLYTFLLDEDTVESGDYDSCYDAEFGAVDEWWQLNNAPATPRSVVQGSPAISG